VFGRRRGTDGTRRNQRGQDGEAQGPHA
jgi:hypothetical protein